MQALVFHTWPMIQNTNSTWLSCPPLVPCEHTSVPVRKLLLLDLRGFSEERENILQMQKGHTHVRSYERESGDNEGKRELNPEMRWGHSFTTQCSSKVSETDFQRISDLVSWFQPLCVYASPSPRWQAFNRLSQRHYTVLNLNYSLFWHNDIHPCLVLTNMFMEASPTAHE